MDPISRTTAYHESRFFPDPAEVRFQPSAAPAQDRLVVFAPRLACTLASSLQSDRTARTQLPHHPHRQHCAQEIASDGVRGGPRESCLKGVANRRHRHRSAFGQSSFCNHYGGRKHAAVHIKAARCAECFDISGVALWVRRRPTGSLAAEGPCQQPRVRQGPVTRARYQGGGGAASRASTG